MYFPHLLVPLHRFPPQCEQCVGVILVFGPKTLFLIQSSLTKSVDKEKIRGRKSRWQCVRKTLAGEFVPAVSTFPWLPSRSHTTPAVDNAERSGLNSVTQKQQQQLHLISTLQLMWEIVSKIKKMLKKRSGRLSHHLTTVNAAFSSRCVLHLKQWYCHLGLFWFGVCSHQLRPGAC